MNWLNDLNNAMDLIEERLPGEVSLEELARAAGCSAFHLQRMFPYLTGLTLADYLRRRRLSLAAMELADGRRVTDVALECGYDSPTAFTRAFKALHGVAPSKVAQGEAQVKAYPRLVFTLSVKGDEAMEYTIKTIPAFRVVGALAGDDWTMENVARKATRFRWTAQRPSTDKSHNRTYRTKTSRIFSASQRTEPSPGTPWPKARAMSAGRKHLCRRDPAEC